MNKIGFFRFAAVRISQKSNLSKGKKRPKGRCRASELKRPTNGSMQRFDKKIGVFMIAKQRAN